MNPLLVLSLVAGARGLGSHSLYCRTHPRRFRQDFCSHHVHPAAPSGEAALNVDPRDAGFGRDNGGASEYIVRQVSAEEEIRELKALRGRDDTNNNREGILDPLQPGHALPPHYEPEVYFVADRADNDASNKAQRRAIGAVSAQLRRRAPLIAGPSVDDGSDASAAHLPSVPLPSPHVYLANMFVDPAMRKRGVGTALLSATVECARRWSERLGEDVPLVLSVDNDNVGAVRLYEKFGFEYLERNDVFCVMNPTKSPSASPSASPQASPTANPTKSPIASPSGGPTSSPSAMADSASVTSFSSLDNVSRSSMLRQKREQALRRHRGNAPPRNESYVGSSYASRRGSVTTSAIMADVMVWEEEKTKQRIEARVLEEDSRRREELAERARAAEIEEERARREERERFEREQLELRRKLEEQKAREEANRLADAKAESERLEKERLAAEAAKSVELERLALERERLKLEAERQRLVASRQPSAATNSPQWQSDEEAYGQFTPDVAGSHNGYQRYLSTFHQPSDAIDGARGEAKEDATIISELTEGYSPRGTTPSLPATASSNADARGSKIKRSVSTRSLSFTNLDDADQSARRPERSREVARKESATSSQGDAAKCTSLKQLVSIENVNLDDPKVMRAFLMQPCPKGEGMVQCSVRRTKGIKNALFPEYRIYLKNSSKTETFLMTSKKRGGSKTSNYLISMNRNDHDKRSDSVVGKLRSNFLGTEYNIYDQGNNPDYDDDEKSGGEVRCELGSILYASNTSLGSKGPRKMRICIPKVDEDGQSLKVWRPTTSDDERMISCFKKETGDIGKLECLENKPPSWNEEVGAYVLNFNGRVTMASVKNFQLCQQNSDNNIMQFGRTGKDEFSLDVSWPMSLFQAFAISLSSFDSKLGCD